MFCKSFSGMRKCWGAHISDVLRVIQGSRRTCHMTRWKKITRSHLFLFFVINMAFQTCSFLLCKGTLFLLFSCLFGVGEGHGFRRFIEKQESGSGALFDEQWFTQKLDHFNGADSREWKQVSLILCYACPHKVWNIRPRVRNMAIVSGLPIL